jgi:hypothetical protein
MIRPVQGCGVREVVRLLGRLCSCVPERASVRPKRHCLKKKGYRYDHNPAVP